MWVCGVGFVVLVWVVSFAHMKTIRGLMKMALWTMYPFNSVFVLQFHGVFHMVECSFIATHVYSATVNYFQSGPHTAQSHAVYGFYVGNPI